MKRLAQRILLPTGLVGGLVALTFGLGYRLPGADRHPDWPPFPGLTNPHLVVEQIPAFDSLYGRRFPFTRKGVAAMRYEDCYRTNLHQICSLGYQITHNQFQSGIRGPLSSWTGVAEMGRSDSDTPPERTGFRPGGYQYLSLQLGSQVGYFKSRFWETPRVLTQFYQYNQPRTTRDTLYLRYGEQNWRIFYR
jgi:hypothetical protein